MEKIAFGSTGMMVTRTSFGALPIQRVDRETAKRILRKAYDAGINFFDTARGYSDSEEKIGYALSDVRQNIYIATKTPAKDKAGLMKDLETSLKMLKTDYIDLYQLHNPADLPDPEDPNGLYQGLLEAKNQGKVRHIGITAHKPANAHAAIDSGLYESLQFPFSSLASDGDIELTRKCKAAGMGFLAMKGLSGGLITNAASTFTFIRQFENVVPIWGIQKESELDEFIALAANPPLLDDEMKAVIERDRKELAGAFCRGCGYCLPCPVNIPINMAARMEGLITRSPYARFISKSFQAEMARIDSCINCGHCKNHCPYGLDTPALLKKQLSWYREFVQAHQDEVTE